MADWRQLVGVPVTGGSALSTDPGVCIEIAIEMRMAMINLYAYLSNR